MTQAPWRWLVAASIVAVLAAPGAWAQSPGAAPSLATPIAESGRPVQPLGPEVPRGALERFLTACRAGDYVRAAEFLDLRKIPRAARAATGPKLARELEAVLERNVTLDLELLSDAPEGERDDDLPPNRDLLATVETERGPVDLLLERVSMPEGPAEWKLAAQTVALIPSLYAELGYGPLADRLPAPLITIRFLGVRLWQWLGLVVLVAFAATSSWLATRLLTRVALGLLARTGLDARFATHAVGPLQLLIAVAIMAAGLPFLALALPAQRVIVSIEQALVLVALTWMMLRALDVMATRAQRRFLQRRQLGAVSMIPLARRVLKLVVAGLAVVAALQNFGFNVTTVAAGLGLGGLAVALAAQKTVENLFGGVTLIADQPVRVGDFCRFGDTTGVVEDIGLRSTRIRTVDRTVVTIPNAQFSAMPIENLSRRDRIPVRATLVLRPETGAARVRDVQTRLRAMLVGQPKVDAESARASFVRLGPQIEIEIFAYILTTQWSEYVEYREQIFIAALEVVGNDVTSLK